MTDGPEFGPDLHQIGQVKDTLRSVCLYILASRLYLKVTGLSFLVQL